MVSALDSGSKGQCASPGRVICVVFLGTQEYKWVPANCQGNLTKCWGVTCDALASHPGGVATLLVASCYRNRDKLRRCGPLGSRADLSFSRQKNNLFNMVKRTF